MQITDILERFTDMVEPYSCDEQFMDVTGSQALFGTPWEIARKVQKAIGDELDIYARVGIGSTKVLAKICCDNFAKKNTNGIYELTQEKIKTEMWKLPVGAMFRVGDRMEEHLQRMGIRTIGHLANSSLDMLKRRWGVNGHLIWMTANGIDYSPVVSDSQSVQKAIGHGMTLPKDYSSPKDIRTVLLELCEEVCYRARSNNVMGYTVSVGANGANFNYPTGFHRQTTLHNPTNNTIDVFRAAWNLFSCFWDRNPIRRIGISISNLCNDKELQLNLFEDRNRKRAIGYTMDSIKNRFGKTAIMRAVSLTDAGQAIDRSMKIGGHYK
jgi:DNA polymerase-4